MATVQNDYSTPTVFAQTPSNNKAKEQIVQSFQERIDALKEQLEAKKNRDNQQLNAINSNQLLAQSQHNQDDIEQKIENLEKQKQALLADMESVNVSGENIEQILNAIIDFNKKLATSGKDYFQLALHVVSAQNGENKAIAKDNNIFLADNDDEAIHSLLKKDIIGSGYSIPNDARTLSNPLEVQNVDSKIAHNVVRFVDEHSGKIIDVPLDDDNMEKLINKFGSLEKATDYVKNWYSEAAYGVGYLQFDTNADGTISKEEAKSLKALVALNAQPPNNYRSLNDAFKNEADKDRFLEEFGFISSLADFINHSIRQDTDTNGSLNFEELTGENSKVVAKEVLKSDSLLDIFAFNRLILGMVGNNVDMLLSLFGNNSTTEKADNKSILNQARKNEQTNSHEDTKPSAVSNRGTQAKIIA